jgi:hypothetical protein
MIRKRYGYGYLRATMYCPKCNQSQASDDMRYCSRCGFPLSNVALLLQNDGMLPQAFKEGRLQSSRARKAIESAILTGFFWAIGLLATYWFDAGKPFEIIVKIGSLIFFLLGLIGLLRFVYVFLFMTDREPDGDHYLKQITEQKRLTLPTPQQTPLSDFPHKANTKEMVRPLSVTENTTQLLDDSELHYQRED